MRIFTQNAFPHYISSSFYAKFHPKRVPMSHSCTSAFFFAKQCS